MAFGQDFEGKSYVGLYKVLEDFLLKSHEDGKRNVLIIDEAQTLGADTLGRVAHDIERQHAPARVAADRAERSARVEAIAGRAGTDAVRPARVIRLSPRPARSQGRVAIYRPQAESVRARRRLFTDEACDLISFATRGTPRLINILCDTALMYGYAMEEQTITSEIVQKVLEDKRSYGVFPMPSGLGREPER